MFAKYISVLIMQFAWCTPDELVNKPQRKPCPASINVFGVFTVAFRTDLALLGVLWVGALGAVHHSAHMLYIWGCVVAVLPIVQLQLTALAEIHAANSAPCGLVVPFLLLLSHTCLWRACVSPKRCEVALSVP